MITYRNGLMTRVEDIPDEAKSELWKEKFLAIFGKYGFKIEKADARASGYFSLIAEKEAKDGNLNLIIQGRDGDYNHFDLYIGEVYSQSYVIRSQEFSTFTDIENVLKANYIFKEFFDENLDALVTSSLS